MPPIRPKRSTSSAKAKASPLAVKQAAGHAQRKSKKLSRGAEKAKAAALKDELNSDMSGLYNIRPDARNLNDKEKQREEIDGSLKQVEAGLQNLKP